MELAYTKWVVVGKGFIFRLTFQLLEKLLLVCPEAPSSSGQQVSLQPGLLQGLVLFSQLGPPGVRCPSFCVPEAGKQEANHLTLGEQFQSLGAVRVPGWVAGDRSPCVFE